MPAPANGQTQAPSGTPDDSRTTAPAPEQHLPTHVLVKRLLRDHIRPYLWRLSVAVLFMAIVAAATAGNAWLMEPALDKVFIQQDLQYLYLVPVAVILLAVVKGFASYLQNTIMAEVGQRIIAETQVRMHAHLMRADLAWLHQIHTGKLISSFLYDAMLLRDAVSRALTGMVKDFLSLIFLAAVMFYQEWELSLVVCLVFPMVGLASGKLGRKTRKGAAKSQEETGRLSALLNENFDGARMVQAYGMEEAETARARQVVEDRLHHMTKVIRARSAASPATEALGGIAVGAAIFYGGLQAAEGDMTLGAFASFITALLLAYQPLKSLANLNTALQEGLSAAQRLFAVLDVEPVIRDAANAVPFAPRGGAIRLADVAFRYPDGTRALRGVTLEVPAGRRVALVGPSGAGKSTVLNLIPRFYDASTGQVLIDGQDVRGVTLASLRAGIALVSQEMTLFDTTVRANIAYGRPGASEAEIRAAAEAAAADDFITGLSDGYDTVVGENGVKLSGGQRQRIAIARAMLRDAPILLLDEATSALDTESERKVQHALKRLMQGRTTVTIAHRLSTVLDADIIYVMDQGRVVEQGDHAALLARGGLYARLYRTQFLEEAPDREMAADDPAAGPAPDGAAPNSASLDGASLDGALPAARPGLAG
ncbi:ABC transporter ATP-binding protein [Marinibaculum pumilum]|uniref:ABC transporter ATP-binding protein n=1 Tax=Marinibaculum pumilum TaxID=1766165 RepID=A0ABV7KVX6_9PROT